MKHAKSLISQADYYPKDGDQLWCVFDCDDNKDSELQAAISYAEKHGYKIAYSNPVFEYWYLLHFEKRNGYLKDSAAVNRNLIWLKWLIFSLKQAIIKSNCLNKIPVSNSSFTVLYNMLKYPL